MTSATALHKISSFTRYMRYCRLALVSATHSNERCRHFDHYAALRHYKAGAMLAFVEMVWIFER